MVMVNPNTAGWTCSFCGVFRGVNQSHTCRTVSEPAPGVRITMATRYRIKGRISPVDRIGQQYDVDLTVEAIP